MTQEEKDLLLTLLSHPSKWCKDVEARDRRGEPVHYDDPQAVAWDIVGGMCRLFGWNRAVKLFCQTWQQLTGKPQPYPVFASEIRAMQCLQDFNDLPQTNYELVISRIRGLKVRA